MGWLFESKSERYERLEMELKMLADRYSRLDNPDDIYYSSENLSDLEREMDRIRLELRCMEAGL